MKCFSNHRRINALAVAVLVTFILLGSSFFVLTNLPHKCTGEDCQVCAEIRACISTLHLLSEAVGAVVVTIFAYIYMKKLRMPYLAGLFLLPASLVRIKVRLDN